jgi:hypothetical protein
MCLLSTSQENKMVDLAGDRQGMDMAKLKAAAIKLKKELEKIDTDEGMNAKMRRSAKRKAETIATEESSLPAPELLEWYEKQAKSRPAKKNEAKSANRQPQVVMSTTTTKMVDLAGARQGMDSILARLDQLPRLPPTFSAGVDYHELIVVQDENLRMELFQDTKELFQSLSKSVEQGQLRPSGKHGKELSKFLELVLLVYSQTPLHPTNTTTTMMLYKECQQVLNALKEWNLDFRNAHYDHAISIANREERWKQASDLFLRQIDPDAGYNPVEISVSNPMGLYAIARFAQEEGSAVVEQVYDAVLRMSMVSPNDQDKCR